MKRISTLKTVFATIICLAHTVKNVVTPGVKVIPSISIVKNNTVRELVVVQEPLELHKLYNEQHMNTDQHAITRSLK